MKIYAIFMQHKIPGSTLLKLMQEAVKWAIELAIDPKSRVPKPTPNPETGIYDITAAVDWLGTAGCWAIKRVARDEFLFPKLPVLTEFQDCRINVNGTVSTLSWNRSKKTERLEFSANADDLSYETITRKLLNCGLGHNLITEGILARMNGEQHSETECDKDFFNSLVALLFGVETSRNAVTFLTNLLLLDLIGNAVRYGTKGKSFSWENAFDTPGVSFEGYESSRPTILYGGQYPMAIGGIRGQGGDARRELQKLPRSQSLRGKVESDPLYYGIARREISLAAHWLETLHDVHKEEFLKFAQKYELPIQEGIEQYVCSLFKFRLYDGYFHSTKLSVFLGKNFLLQETSKPSTTLRRRDFCKPGFCVRVSRTAQYYHLDKNCPAIAPQIRQSLVEMSVFSFLVTTKPCMKCAPLALVEMVDKGPMYDQVCLKELNKSIKCLHCKTQGGLTWELITADDGTQGYKCTRCGKCWFLWTPDAGRLAPVLIEIGQQGTYPARSRRAPTQPQKLASFLPEPSPQDEISEEELEDLFAKLRQQGSNTAENRGPRWKGKEKESYDESDTNNSDNQGTLGAEPTIRLSGNAWPHECYNALSDDLHPKFSAGQNQQQRCGPRYPSFEIRNWTHDGQVKRVPDNIIATGVMHWGIIIINDAQYRVLEVSNRMIEPNEQNPFGKVMYAIRVPRGG